MKKFLLIFVLLLLNFLSAFLFGEWIKKDLVVVKADNMNRMEAKEFPYIFRGSYFIIAAWSKDQQISAKKAGIEFKIIKEGIKDTDNFYLFEVRDGQRVPISWKGKILYFQGREYLIEVSLDEAERIMNKGYHGIRIDLSKEYSLKGHPEGLAFDCTYNPIIADLLNRTSLEQWLDWDKKISGVETVNIGGTDYVIQTRYSPAMFSGSPVAKAYDFALQQAQAWHYGFRIEEDPYNYSGQTWKNLILTIPGQTNPNEIVAISAHYDTTSSNPYNSAPGADDNGSGSSTLYEAARLLRQFRFQRTIKIIFFTGEEQGLIGSQAYVNDHSMNGYLGVVNMDMFGWDGDGDRCFEIHAGTMIPSQDVGNCFANSINSYNLNLFYDFITSGATTASDHASFWNVGVGAIEILENGYNNSFPNGCVGTDFHPYYHSPNDIVPYLALPFVYDIGRAGLATIAAMAIPIGACFDTAPALTATTDLFQVNLNWTAVSGANSYRVYRSTQSCQGQWFELAETTSLNYVDNNITPDTQYYYYVEAVDSDGFCVSAMSNCEAVKPPSCASCAEYVHDSATITNISGGDGDIYPDNCETATAKVLVKNVGSAPAVNTQVNISSSDGFISIITPMPINIGDIPVGSSVEVPFTFSIGQGTPADCQQIGSFSISVQAEGQSPPSQDTFSFVFEKDYVFGDKLWAFEPNTGLEGWTVEEGSWTINSVRVNPGGSTASIRSSSYANNQCDVITSPEIEPASSSFLNIPNWYSIEPYSAGYWWDRANVHIINMNTSERVLLLPTSGKAYQSGNFYAYGPICSILKESGWAGNNTGNFWGNSAFDLSPYAGQKIKIEIRYMTDDSSVGEGIYVDDIQVTNVWYEGCDSQSDICAAVPNLQPYNGEKPYVDDVGSPKENHIIDNDEAVSLISTLENVGSAMATNVSGTVSTSSPIIINQGNASFPNIDVGNYQSCTLCYMITAPSNNRPAAHWDINLTETISADNFGPTSFNYIYHIGESFSDVPVLNEYYEEALFHFEITGGCSYINFCPYAYVLREQIAKFICLGMNKLSPNSCSISNCASIFADVDNTNIFCPFIEELYSLNIISGCQSNPLSYCPKNSATRQEMAKILCLAMNTTNPDSCFITSCSGIFSDVTSDNPFCSYIEALYSNGITGGCQLQPLMYCPLNNITRSQMAKFIVLAFGLAI